MQIVGQLPVIATWRDAPLVLEDLAETICIIKLHAPPPPRPPRPICFKHKFNDNKRVTNDLQGTEHGSPD